MRLGGDVSSVVVGVVGPSSKIRWAGVSCRRGVLQITGCNSGNVDSTRAASLPLNGLIMTLMFLFGFRLLTYLVLRYGFYGRV